MNGKLTTFDQAVQLKAAGYDVPCKWVFVFKTKAQKNYDLYEGVFKNHNRSGVHWVSNPPLNDAADWLREVKGLHVVVFVASWGKWTHGIYETDSGEEVNEKGAGLFDTHTLALSAGISRAVEIAVGRKNEKV